EAGDEFTSARRIARRRPPPGVILGEDEVPVVGERPVLVRRLADQADAGDGEVPIAEPRRAVAEDAVDERERAGMGRVISHDRRSLPALAAAAGSPEREPGGFGGVAFLARSLDRVR